MMSDPTADTPFAGQVAVITGAGSGLGRAMAFSFASAGASVAALDLDADGAARTAAAVREAGAPALSLAVDVADPEGLQKAAATVESEFGGCHVLCANVGVQQFGAIDRLTEEDWRWVLDVNVMGVVRTVASFLPLLRSSSGERHILLTSSSGVLSPGVRLGAYTTSKFAVMGYGETLRQELAPEGIGVTILFPAGMSTTHLQSSARARPAELGPSVTLPDDIEAMLASRDMDNDATFVVTAEEAVRNLLGELPSNPPYLVTHGSYRETLLRRHQELLDAYERSQDG
jgi:NAD(P)-dependent dehydrogenase (short-subunit alcohol dehydrogenase family)